MCGIAGYYGKGDREILEKMTRKIAYRGPDAEGFYLDERVGIGHRRLSIIDLSPSGNQPMANEDGTVRIAFNGEIYNYKDLRRELAGRHKFMGCSDTEAVIHLYEELGEEVFSRLEGMFAIAIYDKAKRKLIIARDRMGKKPLYYMVNNGTLVFGSELKAIMEHPLFKKELDLKSLNKYLIFEYVPTPHTIFKNVHKLEPGHYLAFDGKNAVNNKYWDIEFRETPIFKKDDFNKSKLRLGEEIEKAVMGRLVSDVPLGVFLSGGIDSSAVAYYAQKNSTVKIKTFSIGFKEKSFDESNYARLAACHLQTDHYEKIFSADDCLNLLPKLSGLIDEPFADPSILPTFLLSEFTKGKVTVALGGDGGDELFCGYDTFFAHRLEGVYEKIPRAVRERIVKKAAFMLPVSFKNLSFDFKAKSFTQGFEGEKKYRYQRWLGSFKGEERKELFLPEVWRELESENEFEDIDGYLKNSPSSDYFNQLILLYLRTYLMDDILVKVDRASMYNSLEVRAPFLDRKVVDYANSLPLRYKIKGLKTKYILKKLMEDKLPKEIVNRKKKGFGLPIAEWINGPLKGFVLESLDRKKIDNQGLFNPDYIDKLLNNHFSKKADNRKLIWTLLMFQSWRNKWL